MIKDCLGIRKQRQGSGEAVRQDGHITFDGMCASTSEESFPHAANESEVVPIRRNELQLGLSKQAGLGWAWLAHPCDTDYD